MTSRQERAEEKRHHKKLKNRVIVIIIVLVIIIGGVFTFNQLNKQDKIDTQVSTSPVEKHKKGMTSKSESKDSSISSSSVENDVNSNSDTTNETKSSQSETDEDSQYYVNAYGHTIKKGEQDNTGIAERNRNRDVDLKNLDYIVTAPLTYEQKMIQMKSWGFSFTPAPSSKDLYIWGRDASSSMGAIGIIHTDGSVEKIN
ncbi:hypothetical protein ACFQGR_04630 [Weissella sagaensis]|uniref:Uncharacterized protein n=1 Tax=Weissella sagaensis TaxID=2559928 RepID=A0ABW1RT90_9LACO|nr:hypothetical protein [Weissella sagaensis]